MSTILLLSALLQNADQAASTGSVFGPLPRDPASIFALLLIIGGAGAVMWYGRPKGGGGGSRV